MKKIITKKASSASEAIDDVRAWYNRPNIQFLRAPVVSRCGGEYRVVVWTD